MTDSSTPTHGHDPFREQRIEKMAVLTELGFPSYPNGMTPKDRVAALRDAYGELPQDKLDVLDQSFVIAGRVMAVRSFGKAGFIQVEDATGRLQVFIQKDAISPNAYEFFKKLDLGDIVWIEGHLFRTKTDEFSLKATALSLVTKCLRTLPEKWHGLTDVETRYRQRYIDLIANQDVKRVFEKRSEIVSAIRAFFADRGFLEVETPMMHPIPGGAKAKPFETHHNALDTDLYLRIAPELYLKRLLVGGFERVFELNRNFRNEGLSTQHNPEFTMLEFYQAYATYEDLIVLTETLLAMLAERVCGSSTLTYGDHTLSFQAPFARYTLVDAIQVFGGYTEAQCNDLAFLKDELKRLKIKVDAESEATLGVYQAILFEEKIESQLIQPTFVTHFPIEVSPLSRRNDQNPNVADRFELYIAGREIANAFSELNDPLDQAARFQAQVAAKASGDLEAMAFDADYITALEYGMPPAAGEGIGIDRLVMLLTNSASIRDVILFPQLRRLDGV